MSFSFRRILKISSFFLLCFLIGRGASVIVHAGIFFSLHSDHETRNWGLRFAEDHCPPIADESIEALATHHAYFQDDTREKVLYLTFDCGFENGNTPAILKALKKHHAPATFFVVGNFIETQPELVCQMAKDGHLVGNHSFHHPDMSQMGEAEFKKELDSLSSLYEKTTGQKMPFLYRPPRGTYSHSSLDLASKLGYHTFFWSLAYVDWDQNAQPSPEEALDKLLRRVHPGAIVLLHNTSKTNGIILDELLTKWETMGYHFAPLTDFPAEHSDPSPTKKRSAK